MRSKRPLLFTALGVIFLLAGLITALGIVASWNLSITARGEFIGYALMDFLLAYGFFNSQRWLLPALAVNWLAGAALAGVKLFAHTPLQGTLFAYTVSFCLGGLIFYAVYRLPKKKFSTSPYERHAGSAFLIIWAATACYTVVGLFT